MSTTTRKLILSGALIAVLFVALFTVPRLFAPSACPTAEATAADIAQTVAYGSEIFLPPRWELRTGTHPGLVSVGWFDSTSDGIAHMQLLLYDCGYSQADIDSFYGTDGFNVMLGGYESHTETAVCTADTLTLHEFDVVYDAQPYRVRFWVQPLSPTRVRDVHLGFAAADTAQMDEYAAKLFPSLPSCG